MDYLSLAKEQFKLLMEDMLDEDRHCLGASNVEDYDINGNKFTIAVDGFWEKSTWFDWCVSDINKKLIASGTEY